MKVTIYENERGLLFQDGLYKRMLMPGMHRIYKLLRHSYERVRVQGRVQLKTTVFPF